MMRYVPCRRNTGVEVSYRIQKISRNFWKGLCMLCIRGSSAPRISLDGTYSYTLIDLINATWKRRVDTSLYWKQSSLLQSVINEGTIPQVLNLWEHVPSKTRWRETRNCLINVPAGRRASILQIGNNASIGRFDRWWGLTIAWPHHRDLGGYQSRFVVFYEYSAQSLLSLEDLAMNHSRNIVPICLPR